ncbi:MAG: hypothetical protein WBZ36_24835 [Candidatus Nitrosopolaris sp.]
MIDSVQQEIEEYTKSVIELLSEINSMHPYHKNIERHMILGVIDSNFLIPDLTTIDNQLCKSVQCFTSLL